MCGGRAAESPNPEEARDWLRRARELENAPISTIHSFCSALLRRHALRAGLDPGFAVMDEVEQALLPESVLRQTLLRRLDEEEPTASLLVAQLGLAEALGSLPRLVNRRGQPRGAAEQPALGGTTCWQPLAGPGAGGHAGASGSAGRRPGLGRDIGVLESLFGRTPRTARRRRGGAAGYAGVAADRVPRSAGALGRPRPRSVSMGSIGRRRLRSGQTTRTASECRKAVNAFKGSNGSSEAPLKSLFSPPEEERRTACCPAAELTTAALVEARAGLEAHRQAKASRSLLDYDDLQIRARDLLRDEPEVRRRLAGDIRHLLIDEFQDTDSLQRELLWLAADWEPGAAPPPGKVFFVGDAKQSIYRFRSADVTVFDEVMARFKELAGHDRLRLTVTFRPHCSILDVQNALFLSPHLMAPDSPTAGPMRPSTRS